MLQKSFASRRTLVDQVAPEDFTTGQACLGAHQSTKDGTDAAHLCTEQVTQPCRRSMPNPPSGAEDGHVHKA